MVVNTKSQPGSKPKGASPKPGAVETRQIVPVTNLRAALFGDMECVQSQSVSDRKWFALKDIRSRVNERIWLRLRIHRVRKKSNKMAFFLFRDGIFTLQGLLMENSDLGITREMVKYCAKVPAESVVDVFGTVKPSEMAIKSASFTDLEFLIQKLFVVSASSPLLPYSLDDASNHFVAQKEKNSAKSLTSVNRSFRLDYRFYDVRTTVNCAIFRVQSAVSTLFRQFLLEKDFIEIHTPKIVPGVSEGGSEVFRLNYFNQMACLAQSPQLYKQMAVSCELGKVFEIGPVFRAENANTNRHLTEFIGLDFEMPIFEHYQEILDVAGSLFVHIFDGIRKMCSEELEVIRESFPFEDLEFPRETVSITYDEAVTLINEEKDYLLSQGKNIEEIEEIGAVIVPKKDFSTPNEKLLGKLVKKKYKTDFYIVHRYPKNARPFYTMPSSDDSEYTNSFDLFLRGEEITSGAQRIHVPDLLVERATECEIPIEGLKDYVESFRYGVKPHGGIGIGLERVVMLYLGLENIRDCSLFPRDPKRLSP